MPVYRKGKKKWRVVICHRGRRQDWVVEGTREDAETFEARKRIDLQSSDPALDVRAVPTFLHFSGDLYRRYAEVHLKAGTWTKQSYLLSQLGTFFGGDRLTEIHAGRIDAYKARRTTDGLRAVSINNELRVLKRVLNFARERGFAVASTTWKPLPERGARRQVAWTDKELARFFGRCVELQPDLTGMFVFLANTGCRKGEAIALTWEHVDLERGLIKIWPSEEWQPKSNKPREVPISSSLRPWLSGKRRHEKWAFPAPGTGERYVCFPQRQFDAVRNAAQLKGGPHTLRHTFASQFLRRTPDLFLLARILGHSDVAVTKLYAHLLPDHLEKARDAVSVAAPVGPAALEARKSWSKTKAKRAQSGEEVGLNGENDRSLPGCLPENHREEPERAASVRNFSERDTGIEPATFSLGISHTRAKRR